MKLCYIMTLLDGILCPKRKVRSLVIYKFIYPFVKFYFIFFLSKDQVKTQEVDFIKILKLILYSKIIAYVKFSPLEQS